MLTSWDRSVNTVTRLLTVRFGLQIPAALKDILFSQKSGPAVWPNQLPLQWIPAALSPGVKRPGRNGHRLPPCSAGVKTEWSCNSTFFYAFMTYIGAALP